MQGPITKGSLESNRLKTRNRVSITVKSHHQTLGSNANSHEFGFQYYPDSLDEPYIRERVQLTKTELPLDTGWIQKPGLVILYNTTTVASNRIPTQEEVEEVNSRLIYLYNESNPESGFYVRPGRLFIAEFEEFSGWKIKGISDNPATFKIVVYPS